MESIKVKIYDEIKNLEDVDDEDLKLFDQEDLVIIIRMLEYEIEMMNQPSRPAPIYWFQSNIIQSKLF